MRDEKEERKKQARANTCTCTQASSGEKQRFYPGDLYELDLDVEVFAVCSNTAYLSTCIVVQFPVVGH